MKNKLLLIGMFLAAGFLFAACGGSSGGGGGSSTGGASVDSLSSLPSVDLSQYDSSAGASANLAVGKSMDISKTFGDDMHGVGGASRAGCEQNMHKQEVFRMSQMSQLDRCYPEAMEKAGLIPAIPTGRFAYYSVSKPPMTDAERAQMCSNIPADRVEDLAACESEAAADSAGKSTYLRLGKIGGELQIDMCEGSPATQVNSATYGASGTVYTAAVVRKGNFGGKSESGKFDMSVDIGTGGSVTDSIVTLGTNGLVSAAGAMNGRFGSGNISFNRIADSSVKITGAFAGSFTDPFSSSVTSFSGKTYAHMGGSPVTGCAKFEFTGNPPAMNVKDMIPFNISADDLAMFLQTFGAQIGITLTTANYQTVRLCPNTDFDPMNPDPAIKPMTLLTSGDTCPSVTQGGTECFGVTNAISTTELGASEVSQIFTIAANATAAYYAEVSAFDLLPLSSTIGAIDFPRAWDCTGAFTAVDFASVSRTAIEAAISKCKQIEEKARMNGGMGNEGQCGKGEQMNSVNNMVDDGGGTTTFGPFGGEYSFSDFGGCPHQLALPPKIFANTVDVAANEYCIPVNGGCAPFTVAPAGPNFAGTPTTSTQEISFGGLYIQRFGYNASPATTAQIRFSNHSDPFCDAIYTVSQPSFSAPTSGIAMPAPCVAAGLTDPSTDADACKQLCMTSGVDCRP
ncbi:MAG: hypothetical protein V2A66_05100 [Pseudomonadota bacterium]